MAAQLIIPGCDINPIENITIFQKKVSRAQFAKIGAIQRGIADLRAEMIMLTAHLEVLNESIKQQYPDVE